MGAPLIKVKQDLKLQLSLDLMRFEDSLKIVHETQEYVDWIEAGTTIIMVEGLKSVEELKRLFSSKLIVADLKITAGERFLAEEAFKAGADIITVLASADNLVIKRTIEVTRNYNRKLMVDFLGMRRRTIERAKEIEKLGPDFITLHSIGDPLKGEFLNQLEKVSKAVNIPIAIAGNINLNNIDTLLRFEPSVVIVGGAIYHAVDPASAARMLKEKMRTDDK